jgi:hypothetical protein
MFVPHREHTYGLPRPVTGIASILYIDDVRTSQDTNQWASTASYENIFRFFYYVDDVRFEVFTAVTMKNGVFWVVTPCGSYKSHTA